MAVVIIKLEALELVALWKDKIGGHEVLETQQAQCLSQISH